MTMTKADPIKTTMEPISTTKTKKKKKKAAKKKRKISKHILVANKEREALEKARKTDPFGSVVVTTDTDSEPATTATAGTGVASSSSSEKLSLSSPKSTNNTKDIKEAAGYLTNWKNYRQQWKFNKNTQSWLIRHMYETDKVAKGTFTILLEYLQGLDGNTSKQRVLQGATRRALRYQQYSEQQEEGGDSAIADKKKNNNTKTKIRFAEDTKAAAANDNVVKKKGEDDKGATEDDKRWNALCDHDKRKEYKRARKILETLQKANV
jgi:WKF domain